MTHCAGQWLQIHRRGESVSICGRVDTGANQDKVVRKLSYRGDGFEVTGDFGLWTRWSRAEQRLLKMEESGLGLFFFFNKQERSEPQTRLRNFFNSARIVPQHIAHVLSQYKTLEGFLISQLSGTVQDTELLDLQHSSDSTQTAMSAWTYEYGAVKLQRTTQKPT